MVYANDQFLSREYLPDSKVMRPVLSVIVPTYNEQDNIWSLIIRIQSSLCSINFEIIVVNDGHDGTADVVNCLAEEYDNIKLFNRTKKLGLSSAILEGMHHARGEFVAVIDGDLQHPPEHLSKMYEKMISGHDLVIASRYADGGSINGWCLKRKIISIGATGLAHLFLPNTRRVNDVLSGFFMFKRQVIENSILNPIGYKILLEVISKGNCKSITEVPYAFNSRINGKSKLNFKEVYNYLIHIKNCVLCNLS